MSWYRLLAAVVGAWLIAFGASAERDSAEITGEVIFRDDGGDVTLTVPLSKAVPWKVWLAVDPARIVVEFNDVAWNDVPTSSSVSIVGAVTERHAPEWSRLIAFLHEPLAVDAAEMATADDGSATLSLRLSPVTGGTFRELAQPLEEDVATEDKGRPVVVIDPGHGGRDPGAEAGDVNEATLMLAFAGLLRDELMASGQFDVVLTRDTDRFVHLEGRVGSARDANADVFLSLHADRLSETAGQASGLTVYTLSSELTDKAAERQAARHGLKGVLKGVDLTGSGDDVALALMGLQQQDTKPRTAALSVALVDAARVAGLTLNGRPERQGDFAVLKAADIPSVLIELGFLSSEDDLARLTSDEWMREAARAISEGVLRWHQEDQAIQDARHK